MIVLGYLFVGNVWLFVGRLCTGPWSTVCDCFRIFICT